VEFTVYNVNGIVKRGKRSKRDFSTEWISSCLDFRQTDLNQCSALTYKSLSGCRQLKDVWQVKLKCCVSSGIQTSFSNAIVPLKLKMFPKPMRVEDRLSARAWCLKQKQAHLKVHLNIVFLQWHR